MVDQEPGAAMSKVDIRAALKSKKSKKIGLWALILVVVFGLLGFFAAPGLIKSLLIEQLSNALHRQVSIEKIDINPYTLSARITGLLVKDKAGKNVAGFDELFVNVSSASIFKRAIVVEELKLAGLRVSAARVAEGRYDISDLIDEWVKPSDKPSAAPLFSINNIQLSNGKIIFDDQPKGQVHKIEAINLGLPFVSNLPYQTDVYVQPSFSAIINDSPLVLQGRSKPFSGNRESELSLEIDRFDLSDLQPYLPDTVPLRLGAGWLDTNLKVVFSEVTGQKFSLSLTGQARISDLVLIEGNGMPLLAWGQLDVDITKGDLVNRKFVFNHLALSGMNLSLAVNRKGEFNILALAEKMAKISTKTKTPAKEPEIPLEWQLGTISVANSLIRWRDESNSVPVVGEVREFNAVIGQIDSKLESPIEIVEANYNIDLGDNLKVTKMSINNAKVDLLQHRIEIAEVTNYKTHAQMLRNKEGKIQWVSSPLLKTIRATDAAVKDSRPWVGVVGKLNIEDLTFKFEDQTTRPSAVQVLDELYLQGNNLTNEAGKQGAISLRTNVNKKGSLKIDGPVQIFPLKLVFDVESKAIPLPPVQPYISDFVGVDLKRGDVSNKGEVVASIDDGGFKGGYKGTLSVANLLTLDKANNAELLKWKSLFLKGIDVQLSPMAIQVGELALSDFYSRLILNTAGELNVLNLVPKAVAETQAAQGASATKADQSALPIKIANVTLQNGRLRFSDYFIKPNYSVNVTRLGGRISGLSSAADSVAEMDLRGRYANSASVQIKGQLNPLATTPFLDMKAEIKGVDLVEFSPYSGKYAGYGIEKGKLNLDVAYKLENNQLTAENQLFIDQFTFGNKVDSPDATSLPVNLAISLLKNTRGEIDINLPISGSLDDPDFSVGGLIFKVIGNLIAKAVTSPFSLLGAIAGGGEELSNLAFDSGRSKINAEGKKKLETLAKVLTDRPSLTLEITGYADPESDKEGLKKVALERAVKLEKRKVMKGSASEESLYHITIEDDEYETYLTKAYKEASFPKPRNFLGFQKGLPIEEMEKLMLANASATDEDIRQLAKQRAENVQVWLLDQAKIPTERIFLVPPKINADKELKASRVEFSLK